MATDISIPSLSRLAEMLRADLPVIGDWTVFGEVSYSKWDRWRNWFRSPYPVIEVSEYEGEKVRVFLGGSFSPDRPHETPLTYRAFVEGFAQAAAVKDRLPVFVAGQYQPTGEENSELTYVLNLPVRTLSFKPDRSRQRLIAHFHLFGPHVRRPNA